MSMVETAASSKSAQKPKAVKPGGPLYRGSAPYVFLAPYLVLSAVFLIYPLIQAAILAFYQTNGPAARAFVGFSNFQFLASDPVFHKALKNTTLFAVASVCLQLPLS